ncbi:hypothetical protein HRbin02_01707 [Candidatus Calditenuaceae archaeon HR02]|nr:hypothetical protein HRbin02_01707 [Candidatus Calditenuaceae archaeon HR02]
MPSRVEQLVPALRAALAVRLVDKYGLKKSHVAKALGVSPAAITQYVAGSRGVRLSTGGISVVEIDALADRIARKISLGMIDSASTEFTVFLNQLIAPRMPQEFRAGAGIDTSVIKSLMDRITLEEEAAKRALELSTSANSQLSKMVLKQMAVDSMRHADILATLIHIIENNEDVSLTKDDLALIAEMSRFESKAEEQRLAEIPLGEMKPVIKALLTSIDMDEEKHEMLLKIIVGEEDKLGD